MLLGLLGLVYFRPNAPRIFYPTHLLVDLCIDAPSSSPVAPLAGSAGRPGAGASGDTEAEATDGRCIMVETNYRIYAYTSSVLQEQILRLFVQMLYKMPHMLIGVITLKISPQRPCERHHGAADYRVLASARPPPGHLINHTCASIFPRIWACLECPAMTSALNTRAHTRTHTQQCLERNGYPVVPEVVTDQVRNG